MKELICRLFHPVEILDRFHFFDHVTKKMVGKYRCKKCGKEYLATSKRGIFFRVYTNNQEDGL